MRLPLAATASLLAASAGPAHVDDSFDLSPRVVPGQRVEIASKSSFMGEIEELSVSVNDVEVMGSEFGLEMTIRAESSRIEEVLAAADGAARSKRVDFGRQTMEIDFVADQPGRTKNENAEFDLPLDGRSYVLKLDEEDALQVEEVSDEDLFGGELEEQLLGDLSLEVPFAGLLPGEPVQVGEPFELETSGYAERALDTVLQCADALDEWEGMEGAAISISARWILDEVELEGTGTLREVEGGIATIDYAMEGSYEVDDLVDMVEAADQPDVPAPEGTTGTLRGEVLLKGVGRFDLAAGQMIEVSLEGEATASVSMSIEAEVVVELSAALGHTATLTVQ